MKPSVQAASRSNTAANFFRRLGQKTRAAAQTAWSAPNLRLVTLLSVFFYLLLPSVLPLYFQSAPQPIDYYPSGQLGLDYVATYKAAQTLFAGKPVYGADYGDTRPYSYPPPHILLAAPFAPFPYAVSFRLWQVFSWACLLGAAALASRLVAQPKACFAWLVLVYALSSFTFFLMERGQTDAALLLLITAFTYFYAKGRWAWAGLFLALAALTKVTPGILVLIPLVRRDWRTLLASAATAVICVLATGWRQWLAWIDQLYTTYSGYALGNNVDNSLHYYVSAVFGEAPEALLAYRATGALLIVVSAALLLVARKRDVVMEVAILCILSMFVAPWTANYKLVILLFAFLYPFSEAGRQAIARWPLRVGAAFAIGMLPLSPFFNETVLRLPFTLLAKLAPAGTPLFDPLYAVWVDRRACVGLVILLGLLMFSHLATGTNASPLPTWRARTQGVLAGIFGLLILGLGLGLPTAKVLAEWNRRHLYAKAVEAYDGAQRVTPFALFRGCAVERIDDSIFRFDLVFEGNGTLRKNLHVFLHAVEHNPKGDIVYGRNFIPSIISSALPQGGLVAVTTDCPLVKNPLTIRVGFFDLSNGREYGRLEIGEMDFGAIPLGEVRFFGPPPPR